MAQGHDLELEAAQSKHDDLRTREAKGTVNELQPCISRLWLPTGAALKHGCVLHISATAASQASMHFATANVSVCHLNASIVVSDGKRCVKGARAARVAGHSNRAW